MTIDNQDILRALSLNKDKPLYRYQPSFIKRTKQVINVGGIPEEIWSWNEQLALHKCPSKIRTYRGGNRSGKSHTGAAETCYWVDESHPFLETPHKPIIWVVAPTQEHIGAVCWPKIKEFLPESCWAVVSWYDKGKGIPSYIEHVKGGKIWFKSSAQGRETFQGTAVDFVWMDEDIPSDIVQEVKARTIDRAGRILWTFTPLVTFTEAAVDWSEKSKRGEDGIVEFTASLFGNRHIPMEEAINVYKDWDEYERPIRAYGEFAQLEGLVYNDRIFGQKNIYRDDDMCKGTTYMVIDPGWEVCAAIIMYVDKLGRKWIPMVHYGRRMSIKENVRDMISKFGKDKIPPKNIYIDIAARQHSASTGKSIMQEYEEAFAEQLELGHKEVILTEIYNRDFDQRSSRVRKAFTTEIEEYPELNIHERCHDWFWERRRYVFSKEGDKPRKKHDHLMNCTEYLMSIEPEYEIERDVEVKVVLDALSQKANKHRERVMNQTKEDVNASKMFAG